MDGLTREDLQNLIGAYGEWHISIFMPTVRAGLEVQQNPIRYRNLLRKAAQELVARGCRSVDADRLLAPAQALLDDPALWRSLSDGLAVFVSREGIATFRLPLAFEELVLVKHRFYVKPLLPLLSGDGRFYVLALSQKRVRLLEGTRDRVAELDLEGVPESLAAALWADDPERVLQVRTLGRGAQSGTTGAMFHGHGIGSDAEAKQDLQRYFQKVDRGLHDFLADKDIPLLVAGVDYLLPIYRDANTYPHLLDAGLLGNPDTLTARELHERAWDIVMPFFAQAQEERAERYRALAGRQDKLASSAVTRVVPAAYEGRVDTLFVAVGRRQWGRFDARDYTVHVHPEAQPGDLDLLDLAAVHTFANSGTVYAVDPHEVPGEGNLAAIFRY